ncbi:MAG: hypothetical protein U0X20_12510 [Caldilineaceae bacterium]
MDTYENSDENGGSGNDESRVDLENTDGADGAQPRAQAWQAAVRSLWHFAGSPWLVLALSIMLVLLLTLTWLLPQVPGDLGNEAGAAERWLNGTAAAWGGLGTLFRSLGLFQVMHSTVLQLLLALLLFAILVQFARLLWTAYLLRKTPRALDVTNGINGEPLPIATAGTLLRWRLSHPAPPLALAGELQRLLEARLRHVDRRTVRVAPAPILEGETSEEVPETHEGLTLEERMLALRGVNASLLRPLLPLGMVFALALIWLNAVVGWQFTAPQLSPGEWTADAVHDLRFEYHLEQPSPGVLQPSLIATVGDDTVSIPVTQEMQEQVGDAVVRAQPGAPGLLVQTVNDALLLARPGQAVPVGTIGFGFPSLGSEETLLLPQQAVGLRIVRMELGPAGAAGDGFLVEVFQGGNERAVARITVDGSTIVPIPTFTGDVLLAMTPLPNLSVQVRHGPGYWLLWPALALVVLGALGFAQQAGFVLAQIGPWPPERAVVTLQSDLRGEMASLHRWYSEHESHERHGEKHLEKHLEKHPDKQSERPGERPREAAQRGAKNPDTIHTSSTHTEG